MSYYSETQSERLRYRKLTIEDKLVWKRFFQQEKSTLYYPEFMKTPDSASIWIDKQIERYTQNRFGLMAIELKSTGEFIGQCGLLSQELNGESILEIGYNLLEEYTGNGYASEASQHFKSQISKVSNYTEVYSIVHIDNLPSQKVAINNSMTVKNRINYHSILVDLYSIKL